MGANTKQLRSRIKSVDSTLHLTKAMGLVASSKMRRAMEAMRNGREYELAVKKAIEPLILSAECKSSPYMRTGDEKNVRLIVIAGDRGLAGGYNANVFRTLRQYTDTQIIPIGKRACDRFKKPTVKVESFSYADAKVMADELCKDFANGACDKVGILCTRYVSMMSQEAQIKWILPLDRPERKPRAE